MESSGDPFGGRPIDQSPGRWPWSRRRHRRADTTYLPDGSAAPDLGSAVPDLGSPARPPVSDRARTWWRHWFPFPEEVIDDYLGQGEEVLHSAHPAIRAFVVAKWRAILLVPFGAFLLFLAISAGWALVGWILFAVLLVTILVLFAQGLVARYTAYVITNVRMIRLTGVFSRQIESIPWARVTDLGFEQPLWERMMGYATLHIESANDTMGLKHMHGIPDPVTFNNFLMDMVVAKQGPTAPLGRRSEYRVLDEDRAVLGRRRRRRPQQAERRRSDFAGTDDAPVAPLPASQADGAGSASSDTAAEAGRVDGPSVDGT